MWRLTCEERDTKFSRQAGGNQTTVCGSSFDRMKERTEHLDVDPLPSEWYGGLGGCWVGLPSVSRSQSALSALTL